MDGLKAGYIEGCFCTRPELPAESNTVAEGGHAFRRAVKAYAARHGMTLLDIDWFKRSSYATATLILNHACNHRETQTVRLEKENNLYG